MEIFCYSRQKNTGICNAIYQAHEFVSPCPPPDLTLGPLPTAD